MDEGPGTGMVVGVDGTVAGVAALRWAAERSRSPAPRVVAIAVWTPSPLLGSVLTPSAGAALTATGPPVDPGADCAQRAAQAAGWLDDAVAALAPGDDRWVDRLVREGDVADVLLAAAQDASALVLGNHGRGAVGGALLGSVAHRCIPRARCPLVLVPADPAVR